MRKLLIALSTLLSINTYAQTQSVNPRKEANSPSFGLISSTTEEEYLYMSKGFKVQIESGLDNKRGYIVNNPIKFDITNYSFEYFEILRETNKSSIGYVVKATSKVWSNTYYFAIPQKNEDLLKKSFEEISKLDDNMTTAFFQSYCLIIQTKISY